MMSINREEGYFRLHSCGSGILFKFPASIAVTIFGNFRNLIPPVKAYVPIIKLSDGHSLHVPRDSSHE